MHLVNNYGCAVLELLFAGHCVDYNVSFVYKDLNLWFSYLQCTTYKNVNINFGKISLLIM